jgi:glycerophosphoryl diester phosphodiesterase
MSRWKKILLGVLGGATAVIFFGWLGWVAMPLRNFEASRPVVPRQLVIAHRAASYLAPEETAPAYLLAREVGPDYLEIDAQRTKDGVLVAFHDDGPARTTNVAQVFPGRERQTISEFTLAELKQLDAGSWFNRKYPERARKGYAGARILTVSEVLDIAGANGKKYPVYIETKSPERHPGFEKDLVDLLQARGWLDAEGGGLPKVIFQSFYSESLVRLGELAPEVPRIYLILPEVLEKEGGWGKMLDRAAKIGTGIGPVGTLCWPWLVGSAHRRGLVVHAFTVDETWQFRMMTWFGVDGCFTNRCDALMQYYGKPPAKTAQEILAGLGY